MKILTFNSEKGVYHFDLEGIHTQFHSHPAIEIIFSEVGGIQIETSDAIFKEVYFAIIDRNIPHKITSNPTNINLMMVEYNSSFFLELLKSFNLTLGNGVHISQQANNHYKLIDKIASFHHQLSPSFTNNDRINKCVNYLNSSSSDYKQMISFLKEEVHLSESRLSHLFKEEMGISIKKYLVWSRLKKAFQLVVNQKINLYEAALQSGFYDQAHLSKAFKELLGMNPSEAYNSRTLQDLP